MCVCVCVCVYVCACCALCAIHVHNIQVVAVYGHQKKTAAVTMQFTMTFPTGKDHKGLGCGSIRGGATSGGVAALGVKQHQGVWQH